VCVKTSNPTLLILNIELTSNKIQIPLKLEHLSLEIINVLKQKAFNTFTGNLRLLHHGGELFVSTLKGVTTRCEPW
jgi:hypothetical protein